LKSRKNITVEPEIPRVTKPGEGLVKVSTPIASIVQWFNSRLRVSPPMLIPIR